MDLSPETKNQVTEFKRSMWPRRITCACVEGLVLTVPRRGTYVSPNAK